MQAVMGNEDLAAAILGAIRAADGKSVCAMAKARPGRWRLQKI